MNGSTPESTPRCIVNVMLLGATVSVRAPYRSRQVAYNGLQIIFIFMGTSCAKSDVFFLLFFSFLFFSFRTSYLTLRQAAAGGAVLSSYPSLVDQRSITEAAGADRGRGGSSNCLSKTRIQEPNQHVLASAELSTNICWCGTLMSLWIVVNI